jgi:hypothetical protein
MAKKDTAKFVRPDRAAREAEAAKTSRLRALRLAREAEIAKEKQAKLATAAPRPRVRVSHPPILPT